MKLYWKKEKNKHVLLPIAMLGLLAVFLALHYIYGLSLLPTSGQVRKLPIYSVGTEEKTISISFDAAWGNDHTRPILDILDKHGVKTTFFLVKFWVEKYQDCVEEISKRGHEVQNHSATHPDMRTLSEDKIREEVVSTGDAIEQITGIKPDLFRPPFGAYDNKVIETIEALDYKVIQWSVDSLDWKDISADQIMDRVISQIEPGSIVLFHNDGKYVEEYLPRILDQLAEKGYKVVPIGQLIYRDSYFIDHTGRQIKE